MVAFSDVRKNIRTEDLICVRMKYRRPNNWASAAERPFALPPLCRRVTDAFVFHASSGRN